MIDPRGMTLRNWSDAVLVSVNAGWSLGKLTDDNWQDWAVGFVRAPTFAQRILPDPYQFSDWREWAMRAYPMLEGTG